MPNGIKDPKKLAKIIAKTKQLAGGREVMVNKTVSAGMPGSGKASMLKEVEIVATPIKKKMQDLKEQTIDVAGFGNKSTSYKKRDIISALRRAGMSKEAGAVEALTSTVRGDLSDVVNKIIEKKKIEPYK